MPTGDRLRAYLDEYTEKADDAEAWILNKVLYAAYRAWCEANGERFLPQPKVTKQMEAMGYRKEHTKAGDRWLGIRFQKPTDPPVR